MEPSESAELSSVEGVSSHTLEHTAVMMGSTELCSATDMPQLSAFGSDSGELAVARIDVLGLSTIQNGAMVRTALQMDFTEMTTGTMRCKETTTEGTGCGEPSSVQMSSTELATQRADFTVLPTLPMGSTEQPNIGMGSLEPYIATKNAKELSTPQSAGHSPVRRNLAETPGPPTPEMGNLTIPVLSAEGRDGAVFPNPSSVGMQHAEMLKISTEEPPKTTCFPEALPGRTGLGHASNSSGAARERVKPWRCSALEVVTMDCPESPMFGSDRLVSENPSASEETARRFSAQLATQRDGLTSFRPSLLQETTADPPKSPSAGKGRLVSRSPFVPEENTEGPQKRSRKELECLVCFNAYDVYRLPKCLACQHTFCNVCLKLLLRGEGGSWQIACPLCRVATLVSGGLIRSLPNQEDLLTRLEPPVAIPKLCPTLQSPPAPLEGLPIYRHANTASHSEGLRVATRRLAALLVILVLLLVIILLFLSTGPVRWTLCAVMALSLVLSVLLCWRPQFGGCCVNGCCIRDPQESRCSGPLP
ncbi:E3 ubiquitin-protein ligase RNF186 [Ambystoma mexicanum]|uniref:E3 ubiquitin-protein ligase RNF186 n=1 Tax=Ambystoma mexicanum TaxID=8296 RepID=UPI0037E8C569